ncbi:beta-N-acetylhexosaminidase [Paracoccus aestuariivivens]|uniref:beta-N-acetylhexosaminidase n=1 Tax=Paracoccus aestuariivivens TaxID=1820333 RepID=A0A6L6J8B8_9RHOB|nr:family 20 glycosylhydrolase [Paracoccus aestuariivivens]MTH76979.1 family 20 glycosylhydrolase [Paracoccus aestuariivivens]
MTLSLEQAWSPDGDKQSKGGMFLLRIRNHGEHAVAPLALCLSSMTRIAQGATIHGAALERRFGNYHRLTAPQDLRIEAGAFWQIEIMALTHPPRNRSQGVMSAWIDTGDGETVILLGDLEPPADLPRGSVPPLPEGRIDQALALLPWPQHIGIEEWGPATGLAPLAEVMDVAALHRRLFPMAPSILSGQGRQVVLLHASDIAPEGYRLTFTPDVIELYHSDAAGRRHGLVALAQIVHGAFSDARFREPLRGYIQDEPRFGWRGMHMDVARNFRPIEDVRRAVDILAWHRMNRLHWHLTDDEGWRIEIPALPQLTQIGARRGAGLPLLPQYADPPSGQAGHYSVAEARELVAHAALLGIEVMPEIDTPGHLVSLLTAMPELADPDERPDSYRSIQGYPNNAVNPAIPAVYDVLGQVFDAICAIFPSRFIHVGGDEVDAHSWQQSPAAMALAKVHGLTGEGVTHQLQALFMRRMQQMLAERGRRLAGWDECADEGGVDPEGTLLFAWRSVEKTAELMRAGYDVIATPGQAYYLDMAQVEGWDAIGLTWGGIVPPEKTYGFDASDGLPDDAVGRLVGIQAGVWSEMLDSRERWNAMVFPRLSAIAESGWTARSAKDWQRFVALSRLMPQL